MRLSQYLIPTLKEMPSEAVLPSHQLMLRAGLVSKGGGGRLPLVAVWPSRRCARLRLVVREEMVATGARDPLFDSGSPQVVRGDRPLTKYGDEIVPAEGPKGGGVLSRPHPRGGVHRPRAEQPDVLP